MATSDEVSVRPGEPLAAANATGRRPAASAAGFIALTIAPLAIWLVPFLYRAAIGPFYYVGRVDPSYAYLLNSLLVSCGMNPRYTDHPGTPLEIVGALIIGAMRALAAENPFCPTADVLARPETYLAGISIVLQLCVAVLAAVIAMRLYRITGDIFAACAIQACILISPTFAVALSALGAEILVISAILAFGIAVLPVATGSRSERPHDPIVAGAILGFGLATKLTVLPLILYAFLFVSTKSRLRFVAAFAGSFILWTLPIANMYRKLITWIVNLAIHSERYGEGAVGVPNLSEMARIAQGLISVNAPIFVFACVGLALIGWLPRYGGAKLSAPIRFQVVSVVVLLVELLITAKHPAPHYILPALVAASIANGVMAAALGGIRREFSAAWLAGLLVIGAGPALANFQYYETDLPQAYEQDRRSYADIERFAGEKCGSLIPLAGGVSSPLAGLRFGNVFAEKFDRQLTRLYPDFIFYNPGDKFYHFTGRDGTTPPKNPNGKPICVFGQAELSGGDLQKFHLMATEGQYRLYAMN